MPTDFDLVPVDHDPFDPTGLIGPTQQLGQPSVFDYARSYLQHGVPGMMHLGGAQVPKWMDTAERVINNPDLNAAAGMARPVTPPGFAQNFAKLAAQGLSRQRIADQLGVGTATVSRHAEKLGLDLTPDPHAVGIWGDPENVQVLKYMHSLGASDAEIGEKLGLVEGSIQKKRQNLGLEANRPQGQNKNIRRRFGGTAEGFEIPMSQQKPTLPKTSVADPGEPGNPWLMQQLMKNLESDHDLIPIDRDPFNPKIEEAFEEIRKENVGLSREDRIEKMRKLRESQSTESSDEEMDKAMRERILEQRKRRGQ